MSPNRRNRSAALVLGLVLGIAVGGGAALAAVDAGKVVASRIDGFKKMGAAFKGVNDGVKADAPDLKALQANAKTVNQYAHQVHKWFPAGTGPDSGAKTRAKAEIWSDAAGFKAAVTKLEVEAAKLEKVSKTGDINAIKDQGKALGGACGGCHKVYRGPEA